MKYLILDFGDVLFYPSSGYWFITPKFLELTKEDNINIDNILESMGKYNYIISREMLDKKQEYINFLEFYYNVFKDNYISTQNNVIDEIAYNFTYEFDKCSLYSDVVKQLNRLSKRYKLILFTDNWPCTSDILKNNNIYDLFESIYISSYFGSIKSDGIMFDKLTCDYDISGSIYVDDKEELLDIGDNYNLKGLRMDREGTQARVRHKVIKSLKEIR